MLGGVFVVHPDGEIEDLSPDEARKRPEITSTGRLFPDTLARRIQDAYAYKRGIWNRFVLHEEQTQISDTESNQQPYLIDFGERGAKWVTVAEPYGQAFAANAIFLTDTVTGKTEIWRVPRNASLSGNRRAVQTVRSVSIPGVVFAGEGAKGTGGRFKVVEPRPVFVRGRLLYLVSIIPENGNSVSKSVVVDAARNKVVAIFDNDTDPSADRGHAALPGDRRPRSGRRAAAGVRSEGRRRRNRRPRLRAARRPSRTPAERHSTAPGPVDPATARHAARNRTAAAGDRARQVGCRTARPTGTFRAISTRRFAESGSLSEIPRRGERRSDGS